MREKLGKTKKKSYHLVNSEKIGGVLRQIYVHKAKDNMRDPDEKIIQNEAEGQERLEIRDEVVELWWEWTSGEELT
ncbi:Fc.00g095120.m01.CDS01 [Cosmosporella sp. VM-42]